MNVERKREPVNFFTLPAEVTIGVFLIEVILSSVWICHGAFILENVELQTITLQQGLLSFVAFVAAWKITRGWAGLLCIHELRFSKHGFYYLNKSNKEFCPSDLQYAIIIIGSTFVVICAAASQYVENPYAEFFIYGLGAGSFTGTVSAHFKFYVQRLYVGYPDSMHHFVESLGRSTGLIVTANLIPYLLTVGTVSKGRTILSCMVAAAVYPIASVIHRRGTQHLKREVKMDEEYAAYMLSKRNNETLAATAAAVQTTQPTTVQPSTSQSQPPTSDCEPSTSQFQAAIPLLLPSSGEASSVSDSEESIDEDQTSYKNIFMSLWHFEVLFPAVISTATFGLSLVILATIPYLECRGFGQNCESKRQAVNDLNYVAFVWLVDVCCLYLTERLRNYRSSLQDFLSGILLTGTSIVMYSYRKAPAMAFVMFGGGLGLMAYHESYFYLCTIRDQRRFETIKLQVEALTGILMLVACIPVYYSGWTIIAVLTYIGYFYYVMAFVLAAWVYFPYARSRVSIFYISYMERRRRREEIVPEEHEMQVLDTRKREEIQNQIPEISEESD